MKDLPRYPGLDCCEEREKLRLELGKIRGQSGACLQCEELSREVEGLRKVRDAAVFLADNIRRHAWDAVDPSPLLYAVDEADETPPAPPSQDETDGNGFIRDESRESYCGLRGCPTEPGHVCAVPECPRAGRTR